MIRINSALILICSMGAIGSSAMAQGADDCASAQVITGTGMFPFDNTAASIDGPSDCNTTTGTAPVRKDVWFAWTAPTSDLYEVSTCNLASFGTRIAVYDGTACPPTVLFNCVDRTCGDQGAMAFGTVSGQQYLIRIGSRQIGQSGSAMFQIELSATCAGVPDDTLEPNDSCSAGLVPMGDSTHTGLFVRKFDEDWYAVEVPANGTLGVDLTFTHANGDVDMQLFDTCGGTVLADSQSASDNESISWTNTGSCQTVYVMVNHWPGDPNADCTNYDMAIAGTGTCTVTPIGSSFCTSMPNSTGSAAGISATGSTTLSDQNVLLRAAGAPDNTVGLFFFGANPAQLPFGPGVRCVGQGRVYRMPPFAVTGPANGNLAGEALLDIDFNATYAPAMVPGQLYFQFWFQDVVGGSATFNLTDGVQIPFQ